ncbi:class I SAM-dependent methyltransferase [Streptomyces massasporeus]
MGQDDGYLLDNRQAEAGTRFDALAGLFDASTFRHFEAVGFAEAWRCGEVGAGGPSVAAWLRERVGPSGRVLATDIDGSWTGTDATEGVEVLLHDVGRDDPPPGPFDLVHARLVLVHVTDEETERHLATIAAGRLDLATSPMISAWGRRPTGDGPQSFL